jgi:hypothetical protein
VLRRVNTGHQPAFPLCAQHGADRASEALGKSLHQTKATVIGLPDGASGDSAGIAFTSGKKPPPRSRRRRFGLVLAEAVENGPLSAILHIWQNWRCISRFGSSRSNQLIK